MSIAEVAPLIDVVVSKATVDILWNKLVALQGDAEELAEWQKAFGLLFDRYPSHFHLPSVDHSHARKYSTMVSLLLLSQQFDQESLPLFNSFEKVSAGLYTVPLDQVTLKQALQQIAALLQFVKIKPSAEVTYLAQKLLHSLLIHASASCYAKAKYLIGEFVTLCSSKLAY
jgi:hypothetical protein